MSPGLSNVLLSVLPFFPCQCLCSVASRLLILGLVFPNLTHVQFANSFLDLQGGSTAGYVWDLFIGAITTEFPSAFESSLK